MPRKQTSAPSTSASTAQDKKKTASTRAKAQRTTMCAHRLPPDAYCSRGCDD